MKEAYTAWLSTGTYMMVRHNKNILMGCRHSIVLVCFHDERMIFTSMKGPDEDGRMNSR
jgi:hypothetical protein